MTPARRIATYFESFAPRDLDRLGDYYTDDAAFKDPFNDVRGLEAIRAVYAHMFEALDAPRFVVTRVIEQEGHCVLLWDFHFRYRSRMGGAQCVRGASHLQLAAGGRIAMHRDYWDPAEEVYEKLPLLGSLMRWLKRRASATAARRT
jgi:steroid delta-isomerase